MVQLSRLNLGPVLTALVVVLSVNSVFAEQQFPYVAYITKSDAYVRSGPGQRYYPTQQLPQGHAVEVYRHDGDRWCAVRPPEGSFSVVAAHQVNQLGQGIAEVSANQSVTRVGSLLSPARTAIQVLLPRGERVKVLDSAAADGARWLRIAAPAGEFRWIAAEDLSAQPPMETSPPPQISSGWNRPSDIAKASAQGTAEQAGAFGHLAKSPRMSSPKMSSPNLSSQNIVQTSETVTIPNSATYSPPVTGDEDALDIVAGSPAELQLAQFQVQGTSLQASQLESVLPTVVGQPLPTAEPSMAGAAPRIRFHGQTTTSVPATPRVAELELRLSEIIVRSPAEWQFGQMKAEANNLLATTNLPNERTRLQKVLERITRFEHVQQRYTATPLVASQAVSLSPITNAPATNLAPYTPMAAGAPQAAGVPTGEYTDRATQVLERVKQDLGSGGASLASNSKNVDKSGKESPRFDATGILKPVVSKRENAPQFALVDDQGDVVSFVTPTPDLNLQPYLGQRIGVNGTREYIQEFRRAHVAAGQITPIDGPIRR